MSDPAQTTETTVPAAPVLPAVAEPTITPEPSPQSDAIEQFLGVEEALPAEEQPPAVPVAPPPVEVPLPATPEVPIVAPSVVDPNVPIQTAPETVPTDPNAPTHPLPSWKAFEEVKKERELLAQQVAAQQAQLAQIQQNQQLLHQLALQNQQRQAQQPPAGIGGVDRPYTQQELAQLREENPIEFGNYMNDVARNGIELIAQQQQAMQRQMLVNEQISSFRTRTPDYDEAVNYLGVQERAIYQAAGMNEQQVNQRINERVVELVTLAMQNGRNVGEVAYEIAKSRGYAPKPPTAQFVPATPAPVVVPGTAVTAPPPILTPQQRVIQSQQQSAVANTSLSNVPTSAPQMKLPTTREEFLQMTEAQIEYNDLHHPGWLDNIT